MKHSWRVEEEKTESGLNTNRYLVLDDIGNQVFVGVRFRAVRIAKSHNQDLEAAIKERDRVWKKAIRETK